MARSDTQIAQDVIEGRLDELPLREKIRYSFDQGIVSEITRLSEDAKQAQVQADFQRELQDQTFAISAGEVMQLRGFGTIFEGSSPASMANLAAMASGRSYVPQNPEKQRGVDFTKAWGTQKPSRVRESVFGT